MNKSVAEIISHSLFCEPHQLETPGRILITDCYWSRNFNDCAQLFQIGQRYVFVISFRWAALFQPVLEKIKLGSGLSPNYIYSLLRDRKTFSGLEIEQLQDVFIESDWGTCDFESNLEWWRGYPISYSDWVTWSKFRQCQNLSANIYHLGIDARELNSCTELNDVLANIDSKGVFHLVINQNLEIEPDLRLNTKLMIVSRQRITWNT